MTDPDPIFTWSRSDDLQGRLLADDTAVDDEPPALDLTGGLVNFRFFTAALRRSAWVWCLTGVLGLLIGSALYLKDPPAYHATATVLVAGTDFGMGSSRENAVWALVDYGFKVVIAPRFGDIFRNNATKAGLLPVQLPEDVLSALQDAAEADPSAELIVDLEAREVRHPSANIRAPFEIDDYTRWRLMEGLDDIGLTLRYADAISDYEGQRTGWLPVTA